MSLKLNIYDFGKQLIETKDLDPVYVLLHEWSPARDELRHWLLAYWCFYHVGTASWIANSREGYWVRMWKAAKSKDYLRSSERRHFRGENALKSVAYLEQQDLDGLFGEFDRAYFEQRTLSVADVMEYVQEWVGFGPWIAFKVADMLERLNVCKIQFDVGAMFLFDSPREGAELLWKTEKGLTNFPDGEVGPWAVSRILQELQREKHLKAPPGYERNINVQEAETVLCKWKSYMNGHYELGEDIKHCREGLLHYSTCRTSQNLIRAGKEGGLW